MRAKDALMLAAGMLLVSAFAACTKTGDDDYRGSEGLVRVCIQARGVDSGAMTRSSTGEEVEALLAAAFPVGGVALTLKNATSGISYTATTGESVLLPVGSYAVTGRYKPSSKGAYNGSAYVAQKPAFSVSCTLTIVEGESDYSVPVVWESFALCCDASEVSAWTWKPYSGDAAEPPVLTQGDTQLFFVCGKIASGAMRVTLTPVDLEHYALTYWDVATTASNVASADNGLCASVGCWYRIHPNGVVTESGALSLSASGWTCGAE